VPGLRSLRNRLAVIFALIIIGAIGTIYLSVTPRLEASLTSQRQDQVRTNGAQYMPNVVAALRKQKKEPQLKNGDPDLVRIRDVRARNLRRFAERVGIEVILMANRKPGPYLYTDSTPDGGATAPDVQGVTRQALRTHRQAIAIVATRNGRQALAAQIVPDPREDEPLDGEYVAVFSDSLADVQDNVELIRRQVLISGGIALVIAILAGYLVARALAARVKRLERAARKVASGDFSQPIRADSEDELGQLAAAFDDMQAQLARLDRARKQFIANASHELRTPIFSLGGFLELLANEDLDEATRREFLGTMQEQVERLQKLATDLLDLSRLDAGQLTVELEPLELSALAEALVDEFAAVARSNGHPLEAGAAVATPAALGDEQRVLQIGRVLVENAMRHTPRGTRIRIGAETAGSRVALVVEDSGPGIAGEHAEHVFERFYRVEGALASGSGLGLAIARELAALMGGTLELESRPGRTIFRLRLPAASAVEPRAAEPALA
jgi:two-component system, OmpR family, sensor kinase